MLSVSVTKQNKSLLTWLGITVFCALFSFIYELFSFGVYSLSMISLFVWPLLLGVVPCAVFKRTTGRFWNDGVLLMISANMLKGIYEIYGTSSSFPTIMILLGIVCLFAEPLLLQIRRRRK